MESASNSSVQLAAEQLILVAVANSMGLDLSPKRIALDGGAVVDVDGVAADESVLVEVFAHQGELKSGQRHKIASDALKLMTIARGRDPAPRMVLAFADPAMTTVFAGKSWLAAAVVAWEIEVVVVELDKAVREGIRTAQARQVMTNPANGGS